VRIAAVSDIHGNLPALDAVLADINRAGADVIVNLGDTVSGPLWVAETAERLMALRLPTIRGNHERQVLAPEPRGPADRFAAERLTPGQRGWLAGLPATLLLDADVFCCHGTPVSDTSYFLETVTGGFDRATGAAGVRAATVAEAAARAGAVPQRLILCGHTHTPRAALLPDGRLVVNPGSVGVQAYDDDHPQVHVVENGTPHARYVLLTRAAAGWQVEFRCVPYDWESAARLAESNGRGDWADALRTGRVGRFEAEVLGA
jgi:predicted phosphodiesterase